MLDVFKLTIIFIIIVITLKYKFSLWKAMISGIICTIILFSIPLTKALKTILSTFAKSSTLNVVLSIYFITLLQISMDKKGLFSLFEDSMKRLSNNLWLNMITVPLFMGILPTPGSVLIAAPIVNNGCNDYLNDNEKAFVTSFIRHIPETWLPTYSSVIIALQLSGVSAATYLVGMAPMAITMIVLVLIFYLKKVPHYTNIYKTKTPKKELFLMLQSSWCIILIILLILIFGLQVQIATFISLIVFIIINRFSTNELLDSAKKAVQLNMLLSIFAALAFANLITSTGVVQKIPTLFQQLPIPTYLVFCLIFFLGSIIIGLQGTIVLALPLAFATVPNPGMPLLVLLMCFGHCAMQISPIHICLFLVTDYFNTTFQELIKKTLPVIVVQGLISIIYYLLLMHFP